MLDTQSQHKIIIRTWPKEESATQHEVITYISDIIHDWNKQAYILNEYR